MDVHVEGVVQGVGFRPFVYSLANRLGLAGRVRNDADGVFIEVEGALAGVEEFLTALERDAPALSEIESVTVVSGEPAGHNGFTIAAGDPAGPRASLVPADIATCDDCLRELADPADRRHRYPFISCVNCGPRFTIVRGAPYDRLLTTMAGFAMCPDCAAEYHDPGNRRFHAEPVCCPDCGPVLRLLDARGADLCGDPVSGCAALLR
ncbi:MAG: carbamoyltransferase HypF, partial [Nonomuraea sp.]|nr:carbamoyltransferase HypF [Nonomuraea sp.]